MDPRAGGAVRQSATAERLGFAGPPVHAVVLMRRRRRSSEAKERRIAHGTASPVSARQTSAPAVTRRKRSQHALRADDRTRRCSAGELRDAEHTRRDVADALQAAACIRHDDAGVRRGHKRVRRARQDVRRGLKDALARAADTLRREQRRQPAIERVVRPAQSCERTRECSLVRAYPTFLLRKQPAATAIEGEASTQGTVPGADGLVRPEQATQKERDSPMSTNTIKRTRVNEVDALQKLADGLTQHASTAPSVVLAGATLKPSDAAPLRCGAARPVAA
jgi:hypothetical protein